MAPLVRLGYTQKKKYHPGTSPSIWIRINNKGVVKIGFCGLTLCVVEISGPQKMQERRWQSMDGPMKGSYLRYLDDAGYDGCGDDYITLMRQLVNGQVI